MRRFVIPLLKSEKICRQHSGSPKFPMKGEVVPKPVQVMNEVVEDVDVGPLAPQV